MKLLITFLALILAFSFQPATARADELVDIRADLIALLNRVEALEAENEELRSAAKKATGPTR